MGHQAVRHPLLLGRLQAESLLGSRAWPSLCQPRAPPRPAPAVDGRPARDVPGTLPQFRPGQQEAPAAGQDTMTSGLPGSALPLRPTFEPRKEGLPARSSSGLVS